MSDWVIPRKLTVGDVWNIPKPALTIMAETSNDMVVYYINQFIRDNQNNQDVIVRKVAEKLKDAFEEVNRIKDFLSSSEAIEMAKTLNSLSIEDIRFSISLENLKQYRALILMLFNDEDTVVSRTKALTNQHLDLQIERLRNLLDSYKDSFESYSSILNLIAFMDKDKQLFKNAPFKRNSVTVLRAAVENRDRFDLILYGIEFLIDKKERGVDKRTWRIL